MSGQEHGFYLATQAINRAFQITEFLHGRSSKVKAGELVCGWNSLHAAVSQLLKKHAAFPLLLAKNKGQQLTSLLEFDRFITKPPVRMA